MKLPISSIALIAKKLMMKKINFVGIMENYMLKVDEKILCHLKVYDIGLSDTYFCSIYYENKECFMYSVYEKVVAWVKKNGGSIYKISDKIIIGERKGFIVRIIFPCYGKRDMKNIMATLY